MGLTYFPGETNQIFLQVLRVAGSVPSFPADYTTPQVRIVHVDSGLVVDVSAINMTQLDDNLWTFDYLIPATPFFGTYLAEFTTTIDGVDVETSEVFKVEEPPDIIEQGQGSCTVDGTVTDEGTLQPIPGVTVLVFTTTDLVNAIAKDITDSNGQYEVFLNPGNYKIRFTRVGFIDETHDLVVNGNCTHDITGD